jgi:hypothetical protein
MILTCLDKCGGSAGLSTAAWPKRIIGRAAFTLAVLAKITRCVLVERLAGPSDVFSNPQPAATGVKPQSQRQ